MKIEEYRYFLEQPDEEGRQFILDRINGPTLTNQPKFPINRQQIAKFFKLTNEEREQCLAIPPKYRGDSIEPKEFIQTYYEHIKFKDFL